MANSKQGQVLHLKSNGSSWKRYYSASTTNDIGMSFLCLFQISSDLDWSCADGLVIILISMREKEYCDRILSICIYYPWFTHTHKKPQPAIIPEVAGIIIRNHTLPAAIQRPCILLQTSGTRPKNRDYNQVTDPKPLCKASWSIRQLVLE